MISEDMEFDPRYDGSPGNYAVAEYAADRRRDIEDEIKRTKK